MPGIVGLFTRIPAPEAREIVARMVAATYRESFYERGTWSDEATGTYVGWSLRPDAWSAGQPIRSSSGEASLVFCGEEFSSEQQRAALSRTAGGGDDRRAYLLGLRDDLSQGLASLNGRFHGVLVDHWRGVSTLFVDRYGMQRLYYHETGDSLYFSSEAKSILAVCPHLRTLDERGLAEFIVCGCVLEDRSLFKGIQVLPAASMWEYRSKAITRKSVYFRPAVLESLSPLDDEAAYENLRNSFAAALPQYFAGPDQVGVSLTGGLDTRMIMAWLRATPGSVPCYSFGGTYRRSEDVRVASTVAGACDQPFQEIRVGEELLRNFAAYAERTVSCSDGTADTSCVPVFYANTLARDIAPVRMTGNYGSQVLRPISPSFKPVKPCDGVFVEDAGSRFDEAAATYTVHTRAHPLTFAAFRQAPWHHYGLYSVELSQLSVRSPFLDNAIVEAAYRFPRALLLTNDASLRLIGDGTAELLSIPTDRGLAGRPGRVRRAIRHKYLEFTFKAEYAYDYGMPQWLSVIDHGLAPIRLERIFLGRHKYYHFRVWYRDALRDYVRQMLLDPMTLSRPIWNASEVQRVVREHLSGRRNHTMSLHRTLTLELIHRQFVDGG